MIFSHSNARALCDVPRNVPDDVIELLGRNGGVMMATFVPWFLNAEGAKANDAEWEEIRRLKAEHPDDPDAVRAAVEEMEKTQPTPPSSVSDVADHIDHIRDLAGIDHIGVGSDFDGLHRDARRASKTSRSIRRCSRSSPTAATRTRSSARSPARTCSG